MFFTPAAQRDAAAIEAARSQLRAELRRLEDRGASRGGHYVNGELSRADLTWIPFVEIAARAGVDLDRAETPWLVDWRSRMRARPSYERSYPPHWKAA